MIKMEKFNSLTACDLAKVYCDAGVMFADGRRRDVLQLVSELLEFATNLMTSDLDALAEPEWSELRGKLESDITDLTCRAVDANLPCRPDDSGDLRRFKLFLKMHPEMADEVLRQVSVLKVRQ